jgi:hypothetical protein
MKKPMAHAKAQLQNSRFGLPDMMELVRFSVTIRLPRDAPRYRLNLPPHFSHLESTDEIALAALPFVIDGPLFGGGGCDNESVDRPSANAALGRACPSRWW